MKLGLLLLGIGAAFSCDVNAKQFWNDNSLTVLKGHNYTVPYTRDTTDEDRKVVTFEHASGHSWGDMFMFVDRLQSDEGSAETYSEITPRFSLSKITGGNFSFSRVKDVLLTKSVEYVSAPGISETNNLNGISCDLDVPGFSYFQLSAYRRDNDGKEGNWQITPVFGRPFEMAGMSFLFDGFADYKTASSDAAKEFNFTTQLKVDAGKALFNVDKTFYAGIEYVYWNNKFGIEDGSLPFKTDERNVNMLVKVHF